jgi:hypothetical protein
MSVLELCVAGKGGNVRKGGLYSKRRALHMHPEKNATERKYCSINYLRNKRLLPIAATTMLLARRLPHRYLKFHFPLSSFST